MLAYQPDHSNELCRILGLLIPSALKTNANKSKSCTEDFLTLQLFENSINLWYNRSQFRVPPMPACRYMEMPAWQPRGQQVYASNNSEYMISHSGFKTQRRQHQKSKTGVPVVPQKDLCPPKLF